MNRLFKYASLLMAAVVLVSCHGNQGDDKNPVQGGDIVLSSDKNLIQSDGADYATLTVTQNGSAVKEGVTFFDGNNNVLDIADFKFSVDDAGEYQIWANYGTSNSNTITIRAAEVIPSSVADPKPSSTDFKARVLVTEFTTTGCTFCPSMKKALHSVMYDKNGNPTDVAEKVVLVACHSGLVNSVPDPAYIHTGFEDFCKISGFPTLNLDMYYSYGNYNNLPASLFLDQYNAKKDAAAGISVSSIIEDDVIIAKVTVKPSVAGVYRVGAFLLEDGIYCKQQGTTDESMYTHNSCIRYIDSAYRTGSGESYFGHSLGELAAGKTADYLFVWDLKKIWADGKKYANQNGSEWSDWVEKNLHMAAFVSTIGETEKGEQFYYVNNVVDASVNGKTPFDYE